MPRLLFVGDIGDIQRLRMRQASKGKVPNEKEKEKVCEPLLKSKGKHSPPKQSVEFKSLIWSKITKKFAKKCLDASSL